MFAHQVCAWPMKFTREYFSSMRWNRSKPEIEPLELPVHQHRDAALPGELVDALHLGGVARDAELLLGNHDARRAAGSRSISALRVRRGRGPRWRRTDTLRPCARANRQQASLPSAWASRRIRRAMVRRGPGHRPARRQQDRGRGPHRALVREQDRVRPAGVVEVLVDVDDRIGGRGSRPGALRRRTEERQT